jgi:hypothetical protein
MYRIKGPIQTVGPGVDCGPKHAPPGEVLAIDVSAGRSSGPGAGGARTGAAASRGGAVMRVMAKITIPVESGSRAVKDGSIGGLIQSAAERWKPEAMYFGTFDGHRTAFMVFDMPDSSDMVPFGEPFFMALDADVEVVPVMNADDLQQGFGKLG